MREAERAMAEWLFQPGSEGNRYRVVYKNSMMLLDHLDLWDSNYRLTDDGMDLFLTGKKYGPNSMMFIDLFARLMLINGSHHRLIMDLCEFTSGQEFENHKNALSAFVEHYSRLGYIRYNEGRATERKGGTDQLKYELLLWGKLGLLDKYGGRLSGVDGGKSGWKKGYGFCFNHRRIEDLLVIEWDTMSYEHDRMADKAMKWLKDSIRANPEHPTFSDNVALGKAWSTCSSS